MDPGRLVRGEDRKLVRRSCLVAGLEKQVIWGESCLGHGGCIHSQAMAWASEHPPGHSYPARLSSLGSNRGAYDRAEWIFSKEAMEEDCQVLFGIHTASQCPCATLSRRSFWRLSGRSHCSLGRHERYMYLHIMPDGGVGRARAKAEKLVRTPTANM